MLWRVLNPDPHLTRELARALNVPSLLASLLVNRGVRDMAAARGFIDPQLEGLEDPFLMSGLDVAVSRILQAVRLQEKVLIYGDYDVDGTTAVVILRKALEILGLQASYWIPRRLVDGYGMQEDVVTQAAADGVRLIISVDTGIKAFEVVEKVNQLGLDCIITDHHVPENGLPRALAVLNPKRPDCPYPNKNLCGVGVAFKLVQALFMKTGKEKYLQPFLKIVAIGTIADAVPLIGENRIFAKLGLEGLKAPVNAGLRSLIEVSGLEGRPITSSDVGFRLAPRINAVGRMGGGDQAVELFSANDGEKARLLAVELDRLNRERQQIEDQILKEIDEQLQTQPPHEQDLVLVIDGENWHRGVIGIAATKLMERFHRPVLVIAKEGQIGYGSGRSPKGFPLLEALDHCRTLFDRFGGHAQAVGFQIPVQSIDLLRQRVNSYARGVAGSADLQAVVEIDAEVRLSDLDEDCFRQIDRLSPFGTGNPQPTFAARDLTVIAEPRSLRGKHLKFRVEQDGKAMDAVGWNLYDRYRDRLRPESGVSLAFALALNTFQQMKSLQLVVKDIQFP
ncbi:MAG: single-stranded-DNA-specific exonuclease RecJ [Acidobacteriota bacterium]